VHLAREARDPRRQLPRASRGMSWIEVIHSIFTAGFAARIVATDPLFIS
jgi:hypothetical protein